MHRKPPVDERRARKRRPPVVEGRRRALADDGVDLARHIHVQRLDKGLRGLVRELRPGQQGLEERNQLLRALDDAQLPGLAAVHGLQQTFDLWNERRQRRPALHAEEFNLMMAAVLDHAHERRLVPLVNAHQLAQAAHECGGIALRQARETPELGKRQQVHAARRMEVASLRAHTLAGRGQRDAHLALRPGQGLDAPLLPETAIVVKRRLVAIAHHDFRKREPRRLLEPTVVPDQVSRRDLALRSLDHAVDDVRTEHRMHQHLAPSLRRKVRKLPEAPVEERERRHRMIAARQREDTSASPPAQLALLHDQDARSFLEPGEDAALEDVRVRPDVIRVERPLDTHRLRRHRLRAARTV